MSRVGRGIAVLFVISALIFWIASIIPGDIATVLVGTEGASAQQYSQLRQQLGLNDPVEVRYVKWLGSAIRGDLGTSPVTGRSVSGDIAREAPVSLELAALAMLLSVVVGIPIGALAASRAGKFGDLGLRITFLIGFSVPSMVGGVLLVMASALYFSGIYQTAYVPASQSLLLNLRGMALPTLAVAVPVMAQTAQMTRAALLDILNDTFVTAARAKGLTELWIMVVHALRNVLTPVITLQGYLFGSLLGGLIVIEQIFNLPGLGSGVLYALSTRDYPMLVATTLVIALTYVVVNLVVDLLYPILDVRQRA
jgi:peptide/nickel transport system permease protein